MDQGDEKEQERFEDFVGIISALSKEIQRIKMVEATKLGIKGADVMLLYQLARHPQGLTSAELARRCGVTRAAVSRALATLEDKGFVMVQPDPGAGRYRAAVMLSARGAAAMESATRIIDRVVSESGDAVSERNRAIMYSSLSTILDQLKKISRD